MLGTIPKGKNVCIRELSPGLHPRPTDLKSKTRRKKVCRLREDMQSERRLEQRIKRKNLHFLRITRAGRIKEKNCTSPPLFLPRETDAELSEKIKNIMP